MGAVLGVLFSGFFRVEFGFVVCVPRPIRCRYQDQILRSLRVAVVGFDQEFVDELEWAR